MSRPETRVVEKWGQTPLDLVDPQRRFALSRWNYFHKDAGGGLVLGQWECEDGVEVLDGTDSFDEMLIVVDGRFEVEAQGQLFIAEPGDTIMVMRGRPTSIRARGPARVVFICFPLPEIEAYEASIRQAMREERLG